MKKQFKKMIGAVLAFSLIFGLFTNMKIGSAKTITKDYSVTPTKMVRVAIANVNANNKVVVTYSAYPNNTTDVSRVKIYKNSGFSGEPIATTTFNKTQQHTATFTLPADKTYYAQISSASGNSFSGKFVATY